MSAGAREGSAIHRQVLRAAVLVALVGCLLCGVFIFRGRTAYGFAPTYPAALPPETGLYRTGTVLPERVRQHFLAAIPPDIQALPPGIGQLVQLRQWVRSLVPAITSDQVRERDPVTILDEVLSQHKSIICGDLGTLMTDSARALGYRARQIYLVDEYAHLTFDSHVTTEVWVDALRKWVVMDATLNAYFTDPAGHPLSAAEIHNAYYLTRTPVVAVRDGSTTEPSPANYEPPLSALYRYVGYYYPGLVTIARWRKPFVYLFQQHGVVVLGAPYGNAVLYRIALGVVIGTAALGLAWLHSLLPVTGRLVSRRRTVA